MEDFDYDQKFVSNTIQCLENDIEEILALSEIGATPRREYWEEELDVNEDIDDNLMNMDNRHPEFLLQQSQNEQLPDMPLLNMEEEVLQEQYPWEFQPKMLQLEQKQLLGKQTPEKQPQGKIIDDKFREVCKKIKAKSREATKAKLIPPPSTKIPSKTPRSINKNCDPVSKIEPTKSFHIPKPPVFEGPVRIPIPQRKFDQKPRFPVELPNHPYLKHNGFPLPTRYEPFIPQQQESSEFWLSPQFQEENFPFEENKISLTVFPNSAGVLCSMTIFSQTYEPIASELSEISQLLKTLFDHSIQPPPPPSPQAFNKPQILTKSAARKKRARKNRAGKWVKLRNLLRQEKQIRKAIDMKLLDSLPFEEIKELDKLAEISQKIEKQRKICEIRKC
ncbi:uncharacterized protein LOC129790895 [Lutzomyia longipalpis]|uniref:uncharacterized protein LOC129790895 n=1 Tax=Lutzomyia longipalpis TaxID=7200 RepID=UPI0024844A8C|nr:uncharacterized protein LOC129790895 [Lutzomyia longipalpis]